VKNGVVVPNVPLPEGAFVEVRVINSPIEVPPELQEEFDAWDRASAKGFETVERLVQEGEGDAQKGKCGRCGFPLRRAVHRPENGPR
jgi:hypothetical protein